MYTCSQMAHGVDKDAHCQAASLGAHRHCKAQPPGLHFILAPSYQARFTL